MVTEKGKRQQGNGTGGMGAIGAINDRRLWNEFQKDVKEEQMGAGWLVIVVTPSEPYARL